MFIGGVVVVAAALVGWWGVEVGRRAWVLSGSMV